MKARIEALCPKCGESKTAEEFYRDNARKSGLSCWCKSCCRVHSSKNRQPPEVRRVRSRRVRLARFGLTPEAYDEMVAKQGGLCLVCEMPPKRKLYVDHDHATGKVRGLLCHNCNVVLGLVGEDQNRLQACIDYLNDHAAGVVDQPLATIEVNLQC